jgi:DNA ligase (NAD+)
MKFPKVFLVKLSKAPLSVLQTLTEDNVVELIQFANYNYFTLGKPVFSDDLFDVVKNHMKTLNSRHPILKHVGAIISDSDDRKEKLPYWMGSMDKIKSDSSSLASFITKHPGEFVVSDKLDGNSALFYFNQGKAKLFTRGDGLHGQNISHIIPFINGIPNLKSLDQTKELAVRGELIISKASFEQIKHKGANARNMVAGFANSKIPDLDIAKRVNFVAYSVYHPQMELSDQLEYSQKIGFYTVFSKILEESEVSFQNLSEILLDRRANSEYDVDGLVVSQDIKHQLVSGRNPSYAFAFKNLLTQETAEVVVSNVEWNISKHGYIKPVVEFEGVKLSGVVIKRATGFNADYIKSNVIGPGSRIMITRSGEVIPYILKVLGAAPSGVPQMPMDTKYIWTESKKDIMVLDNSESKEVKFKRLENFFTKIDVKGVGPATVRAFFDAGYTDVVQFVHLTQAHVDSIAGLRNKVVVLKNIQETMKKIDCVTLMEASNAFGHGIGGRKLKIIIDAIPRVMSSSYLPTMNELVQIDGVSDITATKFIEGLKEYRSFMATTKIVCEDKITKKRAKQAEVIDIKEDAEDSIPPPKKVTKAKKIDVLEVLDIPDVPKAKKVGVPAVPKSKQSDEPDVLQAKKMAVPKAKKVAAPKASKVVTSKVESNRSSTKNNLNGQVVVFTGFRNKEWEALIEDEGGRVTTSVSSKTTILVVANKDKLTAKVKAAMESGVAVLSKEEFEKNYL